jgi:tetratricopeptide (TPR) repeat protein
VNDPVIGELRRLVAASEEYATRDVWGSRALETNRQLLELQPGATGVRLRYANCLLTAGQSEKALRELERVAAEATTDLQRRLAQRKIAEVHERRRVAKTDSFEAAYRRALGLRDAAAAELAVLWHERAVELAPTKEEKASALASWASTLRNLRRFADARAKAEEAIAADRSIETNLAAYAVLIAALVDGGALQEAVRQADVVLRVHPRDPVALAAAGRAYLELGKQAKDAGLRSKANACFLAAGGRERR